MRDRPRTEASARKERFPGRPNRNSVKPRMPNPQRRPCATRRPAFTLIELLVVIAIVAILAAILFPVFAAARERGRIATCASNVRQIGLASHMYAQDYDERLP